MSELPVPDPDALAHSRQVQGELLSRIESDGPISLGDYMQFVLYQPGLGYYMAGNQKFGAAGDFVTAPEISALFGRCLAAQVAEVLQITGGSILEFGAGSGQLAAVILAALGEALTPEQYLILEPSAELVSRQQQRLRAELPVCLYERVCWLSQLPVDFTGVVIANEVLDAMPVQQFVMDSAKLRQVFVGVEQGELCLRVQTAQPELEAEVLALQQNLPQPIGHSYRSEINLLIKPWLQALSAAVSRGLVILIDYGYPEREYYLPERSAGTLRCYYRHRMHENILAYPGLQDITADVDFTRVVRAASDAGFDLHGYTSQAQFLLGNDLAGQASALLSSSDAERYAVAQQVNTLSQGSQMGDRFQVMGLSKSLDADLRGFTMFDFSHRL